MSPSLFFVSLHSNLRSGDAETSHERLISWKITRRTGINNQKVFIQYVDGAYRTDTAVSLTPKPVLFLGVLKASVPQGGHERPKQHLCAMMSVCFLFSHTTEYLAHAALAAPSYGHILKSLACVNPVVLTPGVTDSCSCLPPYYRATSRHCACSPLNTVQRFLEACEVVFM